MWFGINGLLYFSSAEKAKIMHHVCDRLKKKKMQMWKRIQSVSEKA